MRLSLLVFAFLFSTVSFSEKGGARPEARPRESSKAATTPESVRLELEREKNKAKEQKASGSSSNSGATITEGAIPTPKESAKEAPGHTVEKAPKAVSKRGAPTKKAVDTEENILADIEKALSGEENKAIREAVLAGLKAEFAAVEKDSDAYKGMIVRERLFLDSIAGKKTMGEKESRAFEQKMLDRLAKDKENPTREELETLATLSCPSKCGHKGLAKTCRRTQKFLAAAVGIVSSVAFAAAWKAYTAYQPKANETDISVGYTDENGGSQTLKIKDINKPVPEEEVTSPKSTK